MTWRRSRTIPFLLSGLLALAGCGKRLDAYTGQWYALYDYQPITIVRDGDSLSVDLGGQTRRINTDHKTPYVSVPYVGDLTLTLDRAGDLNFADTTFTRDQERAAATYEERARRYARAVLADIYGYEMVGTLRLLDPHNCLLSKNFGTARGFVDATASGSIQGCAYTWDRQTRTAHFDMDLPFGKRLSLTSEELFPTTDTSSLAGHWQYGAYEGSVDLNLYGDSQAGNSPVGTITYSGQYQCSADLYLKRQNGYSFQVTETVRQGECPSAGEIFWVSAVGGLLTAEFPVPRPVQQGFSIVSHPIGEYYRRMGGPEARPAPTAASSEGQADTQPTADASEPPTIAAQPIPEAPKVAEPAPVQAATPPGQPTPAPKTTPTIRLVRPLADPAASGVPRLYDLATTLDGGDGKGCALIDPGNPIKRCRASVPASGQYAWGSAWCSGSAAAFLAYRNSAHLSYFVDGQEKSPESFWQGLGNNCLKRRLLVQDPQPGQSHEFKLVTDLSQTLHDGQTYPAGHYELLLTVSAQ